MTVHIDQWPEEIEVVVGAVRLRARRGPGGAYYAPPLAMAELGALRDAQASEDHWRAEAGRRSQRTEDRLAEIRARLEAVGRSGGPRSQLSEVAMSALCHACGVSTGHPDAWRRHYAPGRCQTRLDICRELVSHGLMEGPVDHLGQGVYYATEEGARLAVEHMERERVRRGLRRWRVQVTLDGVTDEPYYLVDESRSKARWQAVAELRDVVDHSAPTLELLRAVSVRLDRRTLADLVT